MAERIVKNEQKIDALTAKSEKDSTLLSSVHEITIKTQLNLENFCVKFDNYQMQANERAIENGKRVGEIEKSVSSIATMCAAIQDDVKNHDVRIKALEERDGKKLSEVFKAVLTILGIVVAAGLVYWLGFS